MSILDPFLSASLEKALYPNVEVFNPGQKALLQLLHHFVFSAYNYAQGIFFPFDGAWEDDRRDSPVDSLDSYVEDMVILIEYIRREGRQASLQDFVRYRSQPLQLADKKRTFFFAEGGDTKAETEEYVFNMFLALFGLWAVGSKTSDVAYLDYLGSSGPIHRFDYSYSLPYKPAVLRNISSIRETFGVLVNPLEETIGVDWVQTLQDFDASILSQGPFHFELTRDISRHLTLDRRRRAINLFCEESVGIEDSLSRLEGHAIAMYAFK
jgi:hypothetical protein